MSKAKALILTVAALLALAVTLHAQTPTPVTSAAETKTFLTQLQRALLANDRNAIAKMIRYPITVLIGGGLRVPFGDPAALLERYDDIFTPSLRNAIARADATDFIVIDAVDGQLRISSITVPRDTDGIAAPTAPAVETAEGAARKSEPRRVAIRIGPRPTQIPGLLARDGSDSLILFLPKGKLASMRLERVPPGAAVIRVVHARTGAPLGARTSTDGRFVSGRPAEGGDYRVEVQRIGNADDGHIPYMLTLTLR
jgi:hypothetical protein